MLCGMPRRPADHLSWREVRLACHQCDPESCAGLKPDNTTELHARVESAVYTRFSDRISALSASVDRRLAPACACGRYGAYKNAMMDAFSTNFITYGRDTLRRFRFAVFRLPACVRMYHHDSRLRH
jgi:hypothetical protein